MKKYLNNFFYKEEGSGGGDGGTPPPEGGDTTLPPAEGGATPTDGGTPPPATSPADDGPKPLIDSEGNFKENWWEDYEELKDDASILQNFKTPNGLAKSLANTKRMVGKPFDPNNFADDTEKAEFYRKLGVPEESNGYEFTKPDDFPEDMEYNEVQTEWFANLCKKYNIPKEGAQGMRKEYYEMMSESIKDAQASMDKKREQEQQMLEKYWGAEDSPTYKAELANAQKTIDAMDTIYDGDLREEIKNIGLGDNPTFFRILAVMGANIGETSLAGVDTGGSGKTKDQALARIHEIEADPEFLKPNSQKQKDMVAERHALRKLINGEK